MTRDQVTAVSDALNDLVKLLAFTRTLKQI